MDRFSLDPIDFTSERNKRFVDICEKNALGMINIYDYGKYLVFFAKGNNEGIVLNAKRELSGLIKSLIEIKDILEESNDPHLG